ncbi:hypothetical protein C8F04DRAFT_1258727 [Mycena alexandri]|uniref:Uncharacterized protein n=1 Tax=Mycena alexandri TaxID=1745969 RepID=A0AAD6SZ45_9AGAR|nr:hypothetical protein C8F04DRAFT_1258727 [Mycena alexandri]
MDPLPLNGLLVTEDWDGFNPDKKGFISPQEAEFDTTGGSDIKIPFQQLGGQCYARTSARFVAHSRAKRIPALRLSVRKEVVILPSPPREIAFLKGHVGNAESNYSVSGSEIELLGDTKKRIKEQCAKALDKLKVADGAPLVTTTLEKLEVFPAGVHRLSTTRTNESHFATVLVVLPAVSSGLGNIRLRATHNMVTNGVDLPKDLTQSITTIAFYTDLSDVRIGVGAGCEIICLTYHASGFSRTRGPWDVPRLEGRLGPQPLLRDAFCRWNQAIVRGENHPKLIVFCLDHQPASASGFKGRDATLLSHIAPLAKAYEFSVYLCQLAHLMYATVDVYHKGYLDNENVDRSQLSMPDCPGEESVLEKLTTLAGAPIENEGLLEIAWDVVMEDEHLRTQLLKLPFKAKHQVEYTKGSWAQVEYTHSRNATLLFIAP